MELRLFVLQKHSPHSYTYVGDLRHTAAMPSTEMLGSLTDIVRHHIKLDPEFEFWGEDIDDIDFVVHRVRRQYPPLNFFDCSFVWSATPGLTKTDETTAGGHSQVWQAERGDHPCI